MSYGNRLAERCCNGTVRSAVAAERCCSGCHLAPVETAWGLAGDSPRTPQGPRRQRRRPRRMPPPRRGRKQGERRNVERTGGGKRLKMKTPSSYAQVAGEDGALPLPPKEEPEPPKEEPKAPEHLPPKEEPEEKFGKQGRGLGAPRSCASPSPGAVGLVSNRLPQPLGRRRGNRGSVDPRSRNCARKWWLLVAQRRHLRRMCEQFQQAAEHGRFCDPSHDVVLTRTETYLCVSCGSHATRHAAAPVVRQRERRLPGRLSRWRTTARIEPSPN